MNNSDNYGSPPEGLKLQNELMAALVDAADCKKELNVCKEDLNFRRLLYRIQADRLMQVTKKLTKLTEAVRLFDEESAVIASKIDSECFVEAQITNRAWNGIFDALKEVESAGVLIDSEKIQDDYPYPISTLPKDGKLLFWVAPTDCWWPGYVQNGEPWSYSHGKLEDRMQPSHWMYSYPPK